MSTGAVVVEWPGSVEGVTTIGLFITKVFPVEGHVPVVILVDGAGVMFTGSETGPWLSIQKK